MKCALSDFNFILYRKKYAPQTEQDAEMKRRKSNRLGNQINNAENKVSHDYNHELQAHEKKT